MPAEKKHMGTSAVPGSASTQSVESTASAAPPGAEELGEDGIDVRGVQILGPRHPRRSGQPGAESLVDPLARGVPGLLEDRDHLLGRMLEQGAMQLLQ